MNVSLSALLIAALSQLSPVATWLVDTGERMVIVEPMGEPVALVQVDIFGEVEDAERLKVSIEQRLGDVEVFIEEVPSDVDDLPPSYGVNVGPFDSFESAERSLALLQAVGFDGFVREARPDARLLVFPSMPALDPIAKLDELLIEDPFGPATDEAMVVAGDWLQARGDPRGELIGLEQALTRAPDRHARMARRTELETWLSHHEASMFGSLAWLRTGPSTLRYELRGGRMHWLSIDARRAVARAGELKLPELIQTIVSAPKLQKLGNLHVRVKTPADAITVVTAIQKVGRLPLETLVVSPTTRPIDHQARSYAGELRKAFPQLWLATRIARIESLLEPTLPDTTTASELHEMVGAPMSRSLRIRIGRGLTSGRELTTAAACELIAGLGESGRVFMPLLDMLLRPRVSHAAAWLLPALPSFPAWVQQLAPRVAAITGNVEHYPIKLRSLAGVCLKKLARHS